MSTVRLSDVQFDPDVYMSYVQENRTDKNAFIASGVAVTNTQLQQRATPSANRSPAPAQTLAESSCESWPVQPLASGKPPR